MDNDTLPNKQKVIDQPEIIDVSTTALVMGNDYTTQKLVVDILQMVYPQIQIDRATTAQSFFEKMVNQQKKYSIIIMDVDIEKNQDRELLNQIKTDYHVLHEKILLLWELHEQQQIHDHKEFLNLIKPFSLDLFEQHIRSIITQGHN